MHNSYILQPYVDRFGVITHQVQLTVASGVICNSYPGHSQGEADPVEGSIEGVLQSVVRPVYHVEEVAVPLVRVPTTVKHHKACQYYPLEIIKLQLNYITY